MNLEIIQIADRGVITKERVVLSVLRDTNLTYYAVFLTRYATASTVENGGLSAFWFPAQQVSAGDLIVLSTGYGVNTDSSGPIGIVRSPVTHYCYWGLNRTVLNTPQDCVVVVEIGEWKTSPMGDDILRPATIGLGGGLSGYLGPSGWSSHR